MKTHFLFMFVSASLIATASHAQEIRYKEYNGSPLDKFDSRNVGRDITDPALIALLKDNNDSKKRGSVLPKQHAVVNINGPKHTAKLTGQIVEEGEAAERKMARNEAIARADNSTSVSTVTQPAVNNASFSIERAVGCTATASSMGNTIFVSGGSNCAITVSVHNGTQLKKLSIVHVGDMQLARKAFNYVTCYYYWQTGQTVCGSVVRVEWAEQHYIAQFQASYVGCNLQTTVSKTFQPQSNQNAWRSPYSVGNTYDVRCADEDTISISIAHNVTEEGAGANSNFVYYADSYILERSISLGRNTVGSGGSALAPNWLTLGVVGGTLGAALLGLL